MAIGVGRRDFIAALGGASLAWPLAARAQQPAMPLIGFLGAGAPGTFVTELAAIRQGLAEAGYVEGQNIRIEYRWAENQPARLPTLAGGAGSESGGRAYRYRRHGAGTCRQGGNHIRPDRIRFGR
jgi:hypothetical protein